MSAKYTLLELVGKSAAILELADDDLRGKFIEIAKEETPTKAREKAMDLAMSHFDYRIAESFAKACRFLAIIRRDHGDEIFSKIVEK